MPEWIQAVVQQTPALSVLAFIVWSERKERSAISKALHETIRQHDIALGEIGALCHKHSIDLAEQYNQTVRDCTEVLGGTKTVLEQVHIILVKMNGGAR